MPYRLSVLNESPPATYDTLLEDVLMPLAGCLDKLEKTGITYASDVIGPFVLQRAGTVEQVNFKVEKCID